jgi:pimeloyl-ACP methyl ester carboxylesterase
MRIGGGVSGREPVAPYRPRRIPAHQDLRIRGLSIHLRIWGDAAEEPVVLLHGGVDSSATFQFLIDALDGPGWFVAPDWRGHGRSGWVQGGYAFADYLADLDALLDRLVPERPVTLVGHSLGGNVALVYAGLRPERVVRLVSLDGFGVPDRPPGDAPAHLARFLASWRSPPSATAYPSIEAMADRLQRGNPRLKRPEALYLALETSRAPPEGGFAFAHDPGHKRPFGAMFRLSEFAACLAGIRAPTLFIGSDKPFPPALASEPGGLEARLALVPHHRFVRIEGAGHNLHHDEPERVAAVLRAFLNET